MEHDPLAAYRKQPLSGGETSKKGKENGGYVAFDAKDKVDRLRIRRAAGPTRSPGYHYLLDVAYDGDYGTNFVLVYTFMMVMVKGQNLKSVIFALETGTADYIQEFDGSKWEKPTDKAAPFIESIEVIVQDSRTSVAAAEPDGQTRH
ncbi:MAG TPA: hypothetical protein VG347_09285 [Verrucomicrobiae bacterium]|nr:hypothetical protein [Verrucomicrobiae bacterium]